MRNKVMRGIWLVIAALSLAIGIFETLNGNFRENYRFFIFFVLAIFLYFIRRNPENPESGQVKKNDHPS